MDAICGAGIGGSGILRLDAVFGNDACHGQHPCRFTVCLRSAKETKVERSEFFDNWHRPKSLLRKVFPAKSLISRGRGGGEERRERATPQIKNKRTAGGKRAPHGSWHASWTLLRGSTLSADVIYLPLGRNLGSDNKLCRPGLLLSAARPYPFCRLMWMYCNAR